MLFPWYVKYTLRTGVGACCLPEAPSKVALVAFCFEIKSPVDILGAALHQGN